MNKHLTLLIVACGIMAALFSCRKNNDSSLLPSSSYTMGATITKPGNITFFTATGPVYVASTVVGGLCTIIATDTSDMSVVSDLKFTITNYTGVGKYNIGTSPSPIAYYEVTGTAYTQTAFASGTIIITGISGDNISGTFSGILTDGSVITNGTFTALGNGF